MNNNSNNPSEKYINNIVLYETTSIVKFEIQQYLIENKHVTINSKHTFTHITIVLVNFIVQKYLRMDMYE